MATQYKRRSVGSLIKAKEPGTGERKSPNYIKFSEAVTIPAGGSLQCESKKFKLDSLDEALANGKLEADYVEQLKAKIEKTPDWVIADVILVTKG